MRRMDYNWIPSTGTVTGLGTRCRNCRCKMDTMRQTVAGHLNLLSIHMLSWRMGSMMMPVVRQAESGS
jgi:hypothetical protein